MSDPPPPEREPPASFEWLIEDLGLLMTSRTLPDSLPEVPAIEAPVDGSEALGRFAVLGVLGAGGMGLVLEVEDRRLGRRLAAKVLREGASPRQQRELILEARVTGQLQHPNIVPVHELGLTDDGELYFTMRSVEGQTLAERLDAAAASGDPDLPERLLPAFLKICEAVELAHSRGIVHRDLKPANVLLGPFGEVLVVDWGLACTTGGIPLTSDPTLDPPLDRLLAEGEAPAGGRIVGTPAFMSPEQAQGDDARIGPATDIYALGAILYQLLARVPPYVGPLWHQVVREVRRGPPPPPSASALARRVPWELEAVVARAMARAPEDRYESVAALRADVEAYLIGRPLSAARYRAVGRVLKWARRQRARLVVAALTLTSLLLLTGAAVWLGQRAARRTTAARLAEAARGAAQAGRWDAARSAAERALALGPDPALGALSAEAGRRVAAREQARRRALARAADERALRVALRPLALRIDAARPYFHIAAVDIGRVLAGLEQALAEVERLARSPRFAPFVEPWRLLGVGWLLVGDARRAARFLDEAARLAPLDARVAFARGQLAIEQTLALQIWSPAEDARTRAARRARGRDLSRQAAESLTRSLAGWTDGPARRLLAQAYLALAHGDPAAVERHCTEGLAAWRAPLGAEAFHLLRGLVRSGPRRRAALDAAIALRPHYAWAYFLRAPGHAERSRQEDDYSAALRSNPRLAVARCNRGVLRFARGARAEGLADLQAAVRLAPERGVVHYQYAAMLGNLGRDAEALTAVDAAVERLPAFVDAILLRARLQRRAGRPDAARADVERALVLEPTHAEVRRLRGRLALERRDWPSARADLDAVLEARPDDPVARRLRARLRLATGDAAGAEADLDRLLATTPDDPRALHERARVRERRGRVTEALADLDRAIALADRPASRRMRARLQLAAGRPAKAQADLDRLLAADPTDREARELRVQRALQERRWDAAAADIERLRRDDPKDGRALALRAQLAMLQGRSTEALADLQRAIVLQPREWSLWAGYGRLLQQTGAAKRGREALQRALELAPVERKAAIRGWLKAGK